MINPREFTKILVQNNLGPVFEVPCSYLKGFLNYLWDSKEIAIENPVNEAVAMGLASGSYLALGKIPIVAIQNSGLMNTLNALTSLNQIYRIPIFYIVTWRGEEKDAPEHDITGKNLLSYLKIFDLPFEIIDNKKFSTQIRKLAGIANKTKKPVVLIIKKNTFESYEKESKKNREYEMDRFEAISIIKNRARKKAVFLSSTGFPARDSFAAGHVKDFYMMGSMGHTFSIGLSVAANTKKKVIVLDGDGSSFMHLGGLASFDSKTHNNLIYVVLDNECYESTGGQETDFASIDMRKIAEVFHFPKTTKVLTKEELEKAITQALTNNQAYFIHVKVKKGGTHPAKRVSDFYSPKEITESFMDKIRK